MNAALVNEPPPAHPDSRSPHSHSASQSNLALYVGAHAGIVVVDDAGAEASAWRTRARLLPRLADLRTRARPLARPPLGAHLPHTPPAARLPPPPRAPPPPAPACPGSCAADCLACFARSPHLAPHVRSASSDGAPPSPHRALRRVVQRVPPALPPQEPRPLLVLCSCSAETVRMHDRSRFSQAHRGKKTQWKRAQGRPTLSRALPGCR